MNLKTLIVEDDASYREILKERLQPLFPSMVIHEAGEGNEALQEVEALKPDLVFMDIRLPGRDGLQISQKIKAKYPSTKIIVLTGYDSLEYRKSAIESGANGYFPKDSFNYLQIGTLIKSLVG